MTGDETRNPVDHQPGTGNGSCTTSVEGREYLCLLDLSLDTVEQVCIQLPGAPVKAIERLSMAGVWEPVAFSAEGRRILCAADAPTMEPVILRLSRMVST